MPTIVNRPILRYPGGKWRLAPWIIAHFPEHKLYVEPFGGGASVLLRKARSAYGEVYNDLDGEVVNLFKVLRENPIELYRQIYLTPFAREERNIAMTPSRYPVERARRLLIRSHMAQGSCVVDIASGFRGKRMGSALPSVTWSNLPDSFSSIVERLRGVVIEHRDAFDLVPLYDSVDTLFYLDPPYVHETRGRKHACFYRHEMSDSDHLRLIGMLRGIAGSVVISGYQNPLYDDNLIGWDRVERISITDGGSKRVECLWISPNARRQISLLPDA